MLRDTDRDRAAEGRRVLLRLPGAVTPLASETTAWISAIATTAIGVLGFVVTIWQWRASGFRPRLTAYVDAPRAAIEVDIENRGRGPGFVHHVAVVDPRGLE